MRKVFIIILSLLFFLFPRSVHAENIETYDTAIVIAKDGSIGVTERIDYVFDTPRHGIFRSIPLIKTNDSGKQFRMALSDVSVTDEKGTPYNFTITDENGTEVLKVGDADRTITGAHWYNVSYVIRGALTYFPGHDELYWNIIGTAWPVPITESSTTVTLPQTVAAADLHATCFVGAQGATGNDCTVTLADTSVTVKTTRPLSAKEGVTVVVGFPKGIVAVVEPNEVVPFFDTVAGKITLIVLLVAGFLWYILAPFLVIRKWWTTGRDPKPPMGEVSAWFSPPKTAKLRDLTPAETGTLVDESADSKDIYASIVDLARRGYLKIIETSAGKFDFAKQKSRKKDADVQPFEDTLLSGIFETKNRVSLKDLDLTSTFVTVKKMMYASLVTDGFFPENPETVRTKYYILAGLAFMTGNLLLFLTAFIFGKNMPRKTLFGSEQAAVGRSLKNFLVSQDRQLKFQAQRQMMFEKLLPYAIAFGVEEVWAKRFEKLGLRQPDWYVSASASGGRFNSVVFAHSIGHAAATSFAQSVAAKSSTGSSSGFSGGFSGGGGGGGGGGSW